MKKYLALAAVLLFVRCSSSVDTATMTPQEYYDYVMELYNDEDYLEAIKEFQNILLQYPGSAINDDSRYYLGMSYFKHEEYILAAYEFSKLIRDMPASPYLEDSQYGLAESYYQLSPVYSLDQKYTEKAIDDFQEFIDFFPASAKVEEAEKKIKELNTKLAEKEFNSARIYEKMEYTNAALQYYEYVVNDYHDTEYAPTALYRRIKLLIEKERTGEALTDIETFLMRYPQDENAEEITALQSELREK